MHTSTNSPTASSSPATILQVGPVNLESAFIGVFNGSLAMITFVYILCLRGLFQQQIFLQKKIFIFLFLNFFSRFVQHALLNQVCSRFYFPSPYYCDPYLTHLNQSFDLLATVFNFTTFLVLVEFWAKESIRLKSNFEYYMENYERWRKWIDFVFWFLLFAVYLIVSLYICTLWFASFIGYHILWGQMLWIAPRLLIRVVLSFSITLLLFFFGSRVYINFSIQFGRSKLAILSIALVSIICGVNYLFLCLANIFTFFMDSIKTENGLRLFSDWPYSFIFYDILGFLEVSANGLLLLVLTPKAIKDLCLKVCCRCCCSVDRNMKIRQQLASIHLDEMNDANDTNFLE